MTSTHTTIETSRNRFLANAAALRVTEIDLIPGEIQILDARDYVDQICRLFQSHLTEVMFEAQMLGGVYAPKEFRTAIIDALQDNNVLKAFDEAAIEARMGRAA